MDGYSLHLSDGETEALKCCLPPQAGSDRTENLKQN